jgi:glutamate-ammonia-ligase adenylyltransferase
VVEAALARLRKLSLKRIGFCIIAFGKLGGRELNYSSDIDLLGLYDYPPGTFTEAPGAIEEATSLME